MDGETPDAAPAPARNVERLFPFVLRAGILMVGRETLRNSKKKLHFVLIASDISEAGRKEVLKDFSDYPVVQHFTAADFEKYFRIKGAKTIGFAKSALAQSIYAEMKALRINRQVHPAPPEKSSPNIEQPTPDAV